MADIKTILRELSVILGFIIEKNKISAKIDVATFIKLLRKYCKNIEECNAEISKIEELSNLDSYQSILTNGFKLGKLLHDKFKFEGEIVWVGSKVRSRYPYDIMIGDSGISLKEDSHILKNPSFAEYLNALVQPKISFRNVHIFRHFALNEFNAWFGYAFNKLKQTSKKYANDKIIFEYPKRGTYIKKGKGSLIFENKEKAIEIDLTNPIDEVLLNKRLGGYIFEHTFSKWAKEYLEKADKEYTRLKKECSLKAGKALSKFIKENLNLNSEKILELLQIYDVTYYYGKSSGGIHLYEVPKNTEFKVKLIDVEIKVPHSQLNVYFTFDISNNSGTNNVIFRVECRYSHGQFKGIPEAKLYYTDDINHLKNLYKIIN